MLKKIEKVKDFSFIRKGPYYRDIFNQIQGYPAPLLMSVYHLCYCLQPLLLFFSYSMSALKWYPVNPRLNKMDKDDLFLSET